MSPPVEKPQIADPESLYGLPLSEFTAARNALAKRLRGEGAREAAAETAAAKKPTTPAWAVNQLVRQEPDRVRELLSLGEQLREAQARLVAGNASDLLELSERERALVDELVQGASRILRAGGARPSDAVLDQIRDTLHAAALDPEAAQAVGSGRLTKERRAVGFGLGAGPDGPGRPPAGGRPQQKTQPAAQRRAAPKAAKKRQPSARVQKARGRLEAARAAADEADRQAGEAEHRLAEARRAADAAARAVRRAEGKARQATRAAEQAAARAARSAEALELLTRPDADD